MLLVLKFADDKNRMKENREDIAQSMGQNERVTSSQEGFRSSISLGTFKLCHSSMYQTLWNIRAPSPYHYALTRTARGSRS